METKTVQQWIDELGYIPEKPKTFPIGIPVQPDKLSITREEFDSGLFTINYQGQ